MFKILYSILKSSLLLLIRLYQKTGFLRRLFFVFLPLSPSSCRFTPTCSQYTYQSIQKYGIIQGVLRGLRRLSRCHPLYPEKLKT